MMEKRLVLFVLMFFSFGETFAASQKYQNVEARQWQEVRSRNLDPGRSYDVSSGTGFFVSNQYIVTNQHVVDRCINISVRGAVSPSAAFLVTYDKEHDLALLKSSLLSQNFALLNPDPNLEIGEVVNIIGYPLEHSQTGQFSALTGTTIIPLDSSNHDKIEFDSQIEKGNSGGPLINEYGSIVGVVQAKKSYYMVEFDKFGLQKTSKKPHQINGIAINLSDLKRFLTLSNADFTTGRAYLPSSEVKFEEAAKNFIVNIHCVKNFPSSDVEVKKEDVSQNVRPHF